VAERASQNANGVAGYGNSLRRNEMSLLEGEVKRTPRDHRKSVAHDRGCVKTQKTEKRREWFFSNRAILNALANLCAPECDFEECSFCRRCASPRFYTTKTHSDTFPMPITALRKVHSMALSFRSLHQVGRWFGPSKPARPD
jgi:hypothetical protein